MKINRVEIISFGKFKNFSIDFSDGFNLIFGKNEDGKSTLMAFISLMLYGTAGSASRTDISGNFRKKYAPWSGEKMSGDMEIDCGGRSYRIHKEFRASAKTDKVTVADIETGDAVNIPPDMEIGKYFLGIDYNAFEKSVFGGTADSFAGTESGDIATRLSNLTDSGEEAVSTKNVLVRIESAMDELVKKRSKGKIALVQDRVEELTAYIEKVNNQAEQRKKLSLEYAETETEISELTKKARLGRLALENEEKRRKAVAYRKLAQLSQKAEQADNAVVEKIGTGNADDILKKCEEHKNSVTVAKNMLLKTEKPQTENVVSEEDMKKYFSLSEIKRDAVEKRNMAEQKQKRFRLMAIFGGVFSVLGIIGAIFTPVSYLSILLGVILFISYILNRKKGQDGEAIKSVEEKLLMLFQSRGCRSAEEFERAYRDSIAVTEKARIYAEAEMSLKQAETSFIDFVNQYQTVSSCQEAENFVKELNQLKINLENAKQSVASYSSACQIEELSPEKLINLAQDIESGLPEEIIHIDDAEIIEEQIKVKNAKLLEIKGMLGAEPDDIAPAVRELEELEIKLNDMQIYYKDLSLAREVLLEAEDEMRRSFAPALKERASEILSKLTNGKYKNLSIDKTYEVEVKSEETGGYRSRYYLSRGTCAQSYLALRLALCEMLSEGESVPLLLDDVPADYDDERASLASKFLEEYAKEGGQILFFTCHNWMGDIKDKYNMLG